MQIFSFSPFGYEGALVSVEVDLRRGIPSVDVVGLADNAVRESRERMRAAIRNSGFEFPPDRVLVSLSPADVKKEGAGFDLPIALAVLAAKFPPQTEPCANVLVMGELDLAGNVRAVRGVHAAVATAYENGIRCCIVSEDNKDEALHDGVQTVAVKTLAEAFAVLSGKEVLPEPSRICEKNHVQEVTFPPLTPMLDFKTVKNQGRLVRALQIAAAGAHNLMVYGPPGCGKTLAVQRLPSILPLLSTEESQSVTRIYSLAGLIPAGGKPIYERPFRAPHQSSSIEGISGGGNNCRPGEISLAHNGVLFLDEAAEFKTSVLQSLRIPCELGEITLSRAGRHSTYPARFQLLIASNPCPCGNYGSSQKVCVCSARAVEQYWKKFSAPLLDRIDIRVPVFGDEDDSAYRRYNAIGSAELRPAIALAVHQQHARQHKLNAHLTPEESALHLRLTDEVKAVFESLLEQQHFSARAANSVLKVARTIADMEGSAEIEEVHVEEAVMFRKNEGGLAICF